MMQPYPAYKDSGSDWLGEIPSHWERKPIRAITQVKTERNQPDLPLLSVYRDYGVIYKDSRDDNYNRAGMDLSNYKVVAPNDLVINKMKTWQGSLGVSQYEGIVSPAYIICELDGSINGKYLNFLLRCRPYVYAYSRISYGVRVDQWDMRYEDFKQIPVFLPPRTEQDAIVAFLEEQTAVLDQFINNKRRLIALLEEQKQVVINTAVTQGLDPYAPRKPSGIEWIGEIPVHWEEKRLKFLTTFVTSGSRGWAQYYSDEGALFIRVGNLSAQKGIYVDLTDRQHVSAPQGSEGERTQIRQNDVLVAITGATIGSVGIICDDLGEAYVNQHVALTRPIVNQVDPRWMGYCIFSEIVQKQIDQLTTGGTKEGLGLDDVRNFLIPLPNLNEQRRTINWIERKTAEINTAIQRAQREIDLIEEYRTTLIAHTVTGKIDVRGAA